MHTCVHTNRNSGTSILGLGMTLLSYHDGFQIGYDAALSELHFTVRALNKNGAHEPILVQIRQRMSPVKRKFFWSILTPAERGKLIIELAKLNIKSPSMLP